MVLFLVVPSLPLRLSSVLTVYSCRQGAGAFANAGFQPFLHLIPFGDIDVGDHHAMDTCSGRTVGRGAPKVATPLRRGLIGPYHPFDGDQRIEYLVDRKSTRLNSSH